MKNIQLFNWAILATLLFSFSSCFVSNTVSKHGVDDIKDYDYIKQREFEPYEIKSLKESKTVFFLRNVDEEQRADFEKAIYSSWDFTPIEVADYDSMKHYKDEGYSFFFIEGRHTSVHTPDVPYDHVHIYLTLYLPIWQRIQEGKYKDRSIHFTRTDLFTDGQLLLELMKIGDGKKAVEKIYNTDGIKNWTPAHVALYLKEAQRQLKNNKRDWLFKSRINELAIARLYKGTLLIPEYTLEKFDRWTGEELEKHEINELLKNYPYKYKIVKKDSLWQELQKDEEVFVFDYVKSSTDKLVRVFSSKQGLIYQDYDAVEYNIEPKDFKRMTR